MNDSPRSIKTYELTPTHGLTYSRRKFLDFKQEIKLNGIREPLKYVVASNRKYVVDGHHRLQAARELRLLEVPAQKVELPFGGYLTNADLINTDER